MLIMILKMTLATTLYVVVTALLWRFWHEDKKHTLMQKLAVGLFFGLCSVASNHIAIDYEEMVLNVRDLGPLAAGLFFDPLAGILSGLIGGIERFIIGEYFGIGSFTRVACSISTVLAGLLSALLNKMIYRGKRPSGINCFFLGAEMEVFHMYAVYITNREDMTLANMVVSISAPWMIGFTAVGLAACSLIIARLSGYGVKVRLNATKKNTPIDMRFQRWLLVVVITLFTVNYAVGYSLQTRIARNSAFSDLQIQMNEYTDAYREVDDPIHARDELESRSVISKYGYVLVDAERMLNLSHFVEGEESSPLDPQDMAIILEHAGKGPFSTRMNMWPDLDLFCITGKLSGPYYLLIMVPQITIYESRRAALMENLFLEILIFTTLYLLIGVLVNNLVVRNLEWVNSSLTRITEGDLDEVVAVEESSEFTKLSEDINKTVAALRELIGAAERRMEEELQLAAEIQDSALPRNFNLPTGNIELYASMTPARMVGGDFYDFFYTGIDQLALVMADVSGKGIPAAMFMMRAKTAIKNFAREGLGPAKTLESVNNVLCEDNDTQMFVTVWLGILDLKTGVMRCANAGHEYPVLKRAGVDYAVMNDEHGFVLGGFENISISEYEIRLNPGDRLFVYTDGIPEARNEDQKQFGLGRLTESLNRVKDEPQEKVLRSMQESVREFAGNEEQFDDITMLGLTWFPPGGEKA